MGSGRLDIVRGVAAGTGGFLAAGLLEALLLPLGVDAFAHGVGSALLGALHLLGMVGVIGFATGAVLALLLPSLDAALGPLLVPSRARELSSESLIEASARGVAVAACSALPILLVLARGGATRAFNRASLVGPYLALLVGLGIALGVIAYFPVRDGVRAGLARWVPAGRLGRWPLPAVLLAVAVAAGAAAVALLTANAELEGFRFRPALFALLALGFAVVLWFRGSWLRRTRVLVPVLLFVAATCGHALVGLGANPASATLLPFHGWLSQLSVRALRAGLDFDGDGHAALLGGGDCDDWNPEIGPTAPDVPGNGIDENCEGGDAARVDPADAGRLARAPSVPPRPLSVVLILIDTVRPDHTGLYGYERPTTPNLDRWAKSATVFERVWAQAPHTPRSLPSILTGRYPSRIGWQARMANFSDVTPDNELLFDVFARTGHRVEAVTAHWYFDQVLVLTRSIARLDNHGTANVRESLDASVEPDVTARSLAHLETLAAGGQPFVLFIHYFAPHARYLPHPELPGFGAGKTDLYDGEIAYLDHHLGPVLERLDQPDLRERTAVAVFSDHGESLGDHGLDLHGRTVFDAEMRVAMVLRVPGISPRRVKTQAALIDLAPTFAELTGSSMGRAQGRSLVPLMVGQDAWPDRFIFMEQLPYPAHRAHMLAAVGPDDRKLIRDVTQNVTMLFDLARDPGEEHMLVPDPGRDAQLVQALSGFLDADPGSVGALSQLPSR